MTTGFVREIIDVLRAQEADIAALKNAYKELAEKGDVVIRCKDCKHYCKDDMSLPFCNIHESLWLDDDWFCADGKQMKGR